MRWAHTAPIYVDVESRPLRARRAEVEFLIKRVEEEIARNTGILSDDAMAEYREALRFYQDKLATAR
jgi:hypothetical protein